MVHLYKNKKYCDFYSFLVIGEAFDNGWWPGILQLLKGSGYPNFFFYLIRRFLQGRSADLTLHGVTKSIVLEIACTKGPVTGTFAWNLNTNDLLFNISKFKNCHKNAFADSYYSGKAFSGCVYFVVKHSDL